MQSHAHISRSFRLGRRPANWLIAAFLAVTWAGDRKEAGFLFLALWLSLLLYAASKDAVGAMFPQAPESAWSPAAHKPALSRTHCVQRALLGICGPLTCLLLSICLQRAVQSFPPQWARCGQLAALFNAYWALFQLLPISPFDGQWVTSGVMEAIGGVRGFAASYYLGASLAAILSVLFASAFSAFDALARLLTTCVFALLSQSTYIQWQGIRGKSACDFDPKIQSALLDAQRAIADHRNQVAVEALETLERTLPSKSLSILRVRFLRALELQGEGKYQDAQKYLMRYRQTLTGESLNLLHELAYKMGDHALVCDLSSAVYLESPRPEVAAINGLAFAHRQEQTTSLHWLQCAKRGGYELWRLLEDPLFDNWNRATLDGLR